MAALFALVLIKIRRKKQEKWFWSVCLIYLLFLKAVKFLNSIASHNKQKQLSNRHDCTHVKYLNVLYNNRRKKCCNTFFLIYCKILPTSYFGYFGHVWPLASKMILPTCRNFDVYLDAKNSIPNFFFFFWDTVKVLQTCYFE